MLDSPVSSGGPPVDSFLSNSLPSESGERGASDVVDFENLGLESVLSQVQKLVLLLKRMREL